jgi:hypothetical protein
MSKKIKVAIYLDQKDADLLKLYAKKMNTTFTGAGRVAVGLGLITMKFAEDPKMQKYFEKELDQLIDENTKAN